MFPEITLLGPSLLSVSPSPRKLRQIEVRPVLSGRPTIPSTVGEGARTPFLHPSVCQQPWAVSAGLSGAGTAARTAVQVCAAQTPETPSQALSCSARNNKSGVSGRAAPPLALGNALVLGQQASETDVRPSPSLSGFSLCGRLHFPRKECGQPVSGSRSHMAKPRGALGLETCRSESPRARLSI